MENNENLTAEIAEDTASEQTADKPSAPTPGKGGLYAKVNMSVRSANIMVAAIIAALVIATVFIVKHNGFTVKFDTDGGSKIESVKVMHSETVPIDTVPVREGYVFTGWYTDSDCTQKWDIESDTVSTSMTLYAGWAEK